MKETYRIVDLTVSAVRRFFSSDFSMEGVGGPVSVIRTGAEVSSVGQHLCRITVYTTQLGSLRCVSPMHCRALL